MCGFIGTAMVEVRLLSIELESVSVAVEALSIEEGFAADEDALGPANPAMTLAMIARAIPPPTITRKVPTESFAGK